MEMKHFLVTFSAVLLALLVNGWIKNFYELKYQTSVQRGYARAFEEMGFQAAMKRIYEFIDEGKTDAKTIPKHPHNL